MAEGGKAGGQAGSGALLSQVELDVQQGEAV